MFYTYVLQSKKDHHWYTGYADDLRKRFRQHNENKVLSTKGRGPFVLIYYEACQNQKDAIAREKYLKSGMGKRYLKNRLKRFLSLTGLAADLALRRARGKQNPYSAEDSSWFIHNISLDRNFCICYSTIS